MAINTDADNNRESWVTIAQARMLEHGALTCLYSTEAVQVGTTTAIEARNGRAVRVAVPAGDSRPMANCGAVSVSSNRLSSSRFNGRE
ncbi:MAG: hypothetical protein WBC62_03135 [Candidatus Macondimonas sp.]